MESLVSISVIIPGHNCSSTIKKTLESIINQKFDKNNLEVIYVDDGSIDDSIQIVEEFKNREIIPLNIISIFPSSGGPSKARNLGIKNAKNEYIFFMDSDDFIEESCFKKLTSKVKKDSQPDYIVGIHYQNRIYKNKVIKNINYCGINKYNFSNKKIFFEKYLSNYCKYTREYCLFEHCWGRLIKSSLVKDNNIFFNEKMNQLEDILFNSDVLKKCDNIEILKEPIYNHVLYGSEDRLSLRSGENESIIKDLKKVSINLAELYKKFSLKNNNSLSSNQFISYFMSSKIMNYIVRISLRRSKKKSLKYNFYKFRKFYLNEKLYKYRCISKDESFIFGILVRLKIPSIFLKEYLELRKKFFFKVLKSYLNKLIYLFLHN